MKKIILTLVVLLSFTGCGSFQTMGDYIKEHPVIASTITRKAVDLYIDHGKTKADKEHRAERVKEVSDKALEFAEENPRVSASDLMLVIDDAINWEGMTHNDKLLVMDLLTLIKMELENIEKEVDNPMFVLQDVLEVAKSAAGMYLGHYDVF